MCRIIVQLITEGPDASHGSRFAVGWGGHSPNLLTAGISKHDVSKVMEHVTAMVRQQVESQIQVFVLEPDKADQFALGQ